ncbi:hypothetical protein E5Q_00698 [Mixia osmundae IAM 14324]|uniref:J domain-containing protein n=2 Tax=Mixia osmundae (strain CBS 9802 / IAM 14324 / JCM 22182 / KY 12970) TaxID=764103 RepID=G7DTZ1_MIXOS|nr:hypothetical protein E5Q_00698 [Mixia osmundae IAM 14324]
MTSVPAIESRQRPERAYIALNCPHCRAALEFQPPPSSSFSSASSTTQASALPYPPWKDNSPPYRVRCSVLSCSKLIDPPRPDIAPANTSTSTSTKPAVNGKAGTSKKKEKTRRIGTDERPLEKTYYETLGVEHTASVAEIKSAYRKLAIKFHPDKNPGSKEAEDRFKQISKAYSTLSDPDLRRRYNEFGASALQGSGESAEEGFVDPESVFGSLFGGEKFHDIIGVIAMGKEMKSSMQKDAEEEESDEEQGKDDSVKKKKKELTPEQKAKQDAEERKQTEERNKAREERVKSLVAALNKKLQIFEREADPAIASSVKQIWEIEAEELKNESYGVELLHSVGHVYSAKAKHYAASLSTPLGIGGWIHGFRSTAHVFSETMSTLSAANELRKVFNELSLAEEKGLDDAAKKELEDRAAQKGVEALFKGTKLEVESVVREVCDRVLGESGITLEEQRRRCAGLAILGQVYAAVRKTDDVSSGDRDYVRIDTKKEATKLMLRSSSLLTLIAALCALHAGAHTSRQHIEGHHSHDVDTKYRAKVFDPSAVRFGWWKAEHASTISKRDDVADDDVPPTFDDLEHASITGFVLVNCTRMGLLNHGLVISSHQSTGAVLTYIDTSTPGAIIANPFYLVAKPTSRPAPNGVSMTTATNELDPSRPELVQLRYPVLTVGAAYDHCITFDRLSGLSLDRCDVFGSAKGAAQTYEAYNHVLVPLDQARSSIDSASEASASKQMNIDDKDTIMQGMLMTLLFVPA